MTEVENTCIKCGKTTPNYGKVCSDCNKIKKKPRSVLDIIIWLIGIVFLIIMFWVIGNAVKNSIPTSREHSSKSVSQNQSYKDAELKQTSSTDSITMPKIPTFGDVEMTKIALNKNAIGNIHSWVHDEYGIDGYTWYGGSPYYILKEGKTGLSNDLAYYIYGNQNDFINKIELVLNICDATQEKSALKTFYKYSLKTLNSFDLQEPKELKKMVLSGREYRVETNDYIIATKKVATKIDTWHFMITTKLEKKGIDLINSNQIDTYNQRNSNLENLTRDFPGKWFSSDDGEMMDITRTINKNHLTGCGYLYFKKGDSQGIYLAACSMDCKNWTYYKLSTNTQMILEIYSNDGLSSFAPICD